MASRSTQHHRQQHRGAHRHQHHRDGVDDRIVAIRHHRDHRHDHDHHRNDQRHRGAHHQHRDESRSPAGYGVDHRRYDDLTGISPISGPARAAEGRWRGRGVGQVRGSPPSPLRNEWEANSQRGMGMGAPGPGLVYSSARRADHGRTCMSVHWGEAVKVTPRSKRRD